MHFFFDSVNSGAFTQHGIDHWGEEGDYYNDQPGAKPPSPKHGAIAPEYAAPGCNLPVGSVIVQVVNIPIIKGYRYLYQISTSNAENY